MDTTKLLQLSPKLSVLIIMAINQQFVPHDQISCTMSQNSKHVSNNLQKLYICGYYNRAETDCKFTKRIS